MPSVEGAASPECALLITATRRHHLYVCIGMACSVRPTHFRCANCRSNAKCQDKQGEEIKTRPPPENFAKASAIRLTHRRALARSNFLQHCKKFQASFVTRYFPHQAASPNEVRTKPVVFEASCWTRIDGRYGKHIAPPSCGGGVNTPRTPCPGLFKVVSPMVRWPLLTRLRFVREPEEPLHCPHNDDLHARLESGRSRSS